MRKTLLSLLFLATACFYSFGQVSTVDSLPVENLNWFNKDPDINDIYGASVEKAYEGILSGKKPVAKIIVAVIDGGVDINHPDLEGKIWTNTKEIPENGIDDDGNGYVDDIHGWNFLGNKKGENINEEVYEQVRIIRAFDSVFAKYSSIDQVPANQHKDFETYDACKKTMKERIDKALKSKKNLEKLEEDIEKDEKTMTEFFGKKNYSAEDLCKVSGASEKVMSASEFLCRLNKQGFNHKTLLAMKERNATQLEKQYNKDFNPRTLVGDNPFNINDKSYGNKDVKGPTSDHGTFVSGIIAAKRNNNIGIDGIADNVQIMVIRVVPNGDERDKDVALGIRYAVDNGARIINMSFGKDYSPQKSFVDDAILYAEQHNVLLIHAAGNNSDNIDATPRFPTKTTLAGTQVKSWINVGANTKTKDKNFCGVFTNYGQTQVDLFAPGVNIISLAPENKYKMGNGTSFSCPVVAGVAALVLSYYPELTALQLKEILLASVTKVGKRVYVPSVAVGKKKKARFKKLSLTGGIVNAERALELAGKQEAGGRRQK